MAAIKPLKPSKFTYFDTYEGGWDLWASMEKSRTYAMALDKIKSDKKRFPNAMIIKITAEIIQEDQ